MGQTFRKNTLILIKSAVFLCVSLMASNGEEQFLRANQEYKRKKYKDAVVLYDSIKNKGRATWYNMGNCYYHMNQYIDALVCWRRAQNGSCQNEYDAIMHNIDTLHACTGSFYAQKTGFDNLVMRKINSVSLLTFQWLFLIGLFLGIFLFKRLRRTGIYRIILLLHMGLTMLTGIACGIKYHQQKQVFGVVREKQAQLFSGPNNAYHVLLSLQETDEVLVQEQKPGWYKICIDNTIGWVPVDTVELI